MKVYSLFVVALSVNGLAYFTFRQADNAPLQYAPFWDHVCEAIFICGFIGAVIYTIINRKIMLKRFTSVVTIILLLFCSPAPFILMFKLFNPLPEIIMSSSDYKYAPKLVYKIEHWTYSSNDKKYVDKLYIADSVQFEKLVDSAFVKYGKWEYFSNDSKLIKIENYKQPLPIDQPYPKEDMPKQKK